MRPILTVFLALMLLPVNPATAACAIAMGQVQVNPPTTGAMACYDIPFASSCDIPAGEFVQIIFPIGTDLGYVNWQSVWFDGRKDRWEVSGQTAIVQLTSDLKAGSHKITICNAINPPNIGPHQVFIATKDGTYGSPSFFFKETGVTPATVVAKPDYVRECAEYTITFNVTSESGKGCGCSRETLFNLDFPIEFEIPVSIDPKYITVNGVSADSVSVVGKRIIIKSRLSFQAGQQVTIKIDSRAGIKNPSKPGWHRINIFTSADRISTPSNPFYIRPSSVSRATVVAASPSACSETSMVFRFSTGPYGEISGGGYVKIYFPEGFKVPSVVEPDNVTVNGSKVAGRISGMADTISRGTYITIPVTKAIGSSTEVEIVVLGGAGIRMPELYGSHSVDIETSAEPVRVPSIPFMVEKSRIGSVSYFADPSYVTLPARQVVSFKTGGCGGLVPGVDTITISFPDAMWMPKSLLCKTITVNDTPITGIPYIAGFQLAIPVPKPIDGDTWVTVVIPEDCGIRNPTKAGAGYRTKVWTTREQTPALSGVTVFSATQLSGVKVEFSRQLVMSRVKARIQFVTGQAGSVRSGSRILVTIPDGFEFRGAVSAMNFTVDGATCKGARWNKPVLELTAPRDLSPKSPVNIDFDEDAGLTTPSMPGQYRFHVSTDSEPSPSESDSVPVNSKPEVTLAYPKANERGWHVLEPVVLMNSTSALDKSPELTVVLDNERIETKGIARIPDGYHVLEVIATDMYGNMSEKQIVSFQVDTIAPMFDSDTSTFHTNARSFFKMIRAKDENSLQTAWEGDEGIAFSQSLANFVSININSREERCLRGRLTAVDEAGNKAEFDFMVCLDWTAPALEVPSRLESNDPVIIFSGVTEKGCEVVAKDRIQVEPDGTFKISAKLNNGVNIITVQAKDLAGNITRKTVAIVANLEVSLVFENGRRDVFLNGQKTTLKTAPFILKGSMYVPFDLLVKNCAFKLESWPYSESTLKVDGAKWRFGHPKKSIEMADGNITAVIDGELMKMPVAPVMKSGVLYVPLRFTVGLFGLAPVADGKTIKISFTKN